MREAFPSLPFDTIEVIKENDTTINRDGGAYGKNNTIGYTHETEYGTTTNSSTNNTNATATSAGTAVYGAQQHQHDNQQHHNQEHQQTQQQQQQYQLHYQQLQHSQFQQQQQHDNSGPSSADDKYGSASTAVSALLPHLPFSGELEELRYILHFPEEVALRITDSEYQLFSQVGESSRLLLIPRL